MQAPSGAGQVWSAGNCEPEVIQHAQQCGEQVFKRARDSQVQQLVFGGETRKAWTLTGVSSSSMSEGGQKAISLIFLIQNISYCVRQSL